MWLTDSDCGEEWLNMSMFLLTVSQTSFRYSFISIKYLADF